MKTKFWLLPLPFIRVHWCSFVVPFTRYRFASRFSSIRLTPASGRVALAR